jgi:transcriptional regulator with XRE-family HTH domain
MTNNKNNTLGEYVRARRHAKGLSLAQAEDRSGIDFTYWSRLELGELKSPNPRHLAAIAAALDLPVQELYGMAGYYLPKLLPSLGPYLRARYDLDADGIAQVLAVFEQLHDHDDETPDRRAA